MPKYRMTYPYPRRWGGLGISAQPGEVIERDENPDPNFFEEVDASTPVGVPEAAEPAASAPPAPADPPPAPEPAAPVIPAESPDTATEEN